MTEVERERLEHWRDDYTKAIVELEKNVADLEKDLADDRASLFAQRAALDALNRELGETSPTDANVAWAAVDQSGRWMSGVNCTTGVLIHAQEYRTKSDLAQYLAMNWANPNRFAIVPLPASWFTEAH